MQIGNLTRRFAEPVDSWFPEKGEPVLCCSEIWDLACIGRFDEKLKNGLYLVAGLQRDTIRRIIYPDDTDTVVALKLVSIPIKEWPEAPEGDMNP